MALLGPGWGRPGNSLGWFSGSPDSWIESRESKCHCLSTVVLPFGFTPDEVVHVSRFAEDCFFAVSAGGSVGFGSRDLGEAREVRSTADTPCQLLVVILKINRRV